MQITNVEMKTASNGNEYKQITFAAKMFGDKDRVNLFNNHSMYAKCEVGVDVPEELLFINERGYLDMKDESAKPKKAQVTEMALKMHIDQYMAPMVSSLKRIEDHLGIERVGKPHYPTPEEEGIDVSKSGEEIKPEDIPF